MAASKLKRVRVEFFSNIMARTRSLAGASASARPWGQPLRACLAGVGVVEDGAQLFGFEPVDVEEVPDHFDLRWN
jgi:hypothetical protein